MTEHRRVEDNLSDEEREVLRDVIQTWREFRSGVKFFQIVGRVLYWAAGIGLGVAAFLGLHHGGITK